MIALALSDPCQPTPLLVGGSEDASALHPVYITLDDERKAKSFVHFFYRGQGLLDQIGCLLNCEEVSQEHVNTLERRLHKVLAWQAQIPTLAARQLSTVVPSVPV